MVEVRSLLSLECPVARTSGFQMCIGTDRSGSTSFPRDDILLQTFFLQMVNSIIHFTAAKHPY